MKPSIRIAAAMLPLSLCAASAAAQGDAGVYVGALVGVSTLQADGRSVTYDLGGTAGTSDMADAVIERLAAADDAERARPVAPAPAS